MPTDKEIITTWWREAWDQGLWAASWKASIEGLTAAQAAWKPAPERHSIWQIVLHMCFWREAYLKRVRGGPKPTKDERAHLNFPEITDTSEPAWAAARDRFARTQREVADALADDSLDTAALAYALPHDCYHMGQINLLRALQGLEPID